MATIQNAALSFLGFNVNSVVFERPEGLVIGEFNTNIEHLAQINSADKNSPFNLQVKATSDFQIIGDVPDPIYQSFINVNAPAIAYPYLRAFVSNLVLQSGMPPIIIPPLNFTQPDIKKGLPQQSKVEATK